jgi:putative transcription factor
MPTCEICGSRTDDIYRVSVEGTEMKTCIKCTKYGKVISRIVIETPKEEKKRKITISNVIEPEEAVVKNYASIVRQAREKRELNQEEFAKMLNERLSVMKSIEQNKLIPDLKLAKKLEQELNIKLIEEVKESTEHYSPEKTGPATLGDIIKIKKKD